MLVQRWRVRLLVLPVAVMLWLFGSQGAHAEEFLVVEQPAHLRIFNRYQQRLSSEEQRRLLPFTPFRIIADDDVLGDGFTPCVRVEVHGDLYFIQKNERDDLLGADQAGFIKRVRGAVLHNDSIEVIETAGLPWFEPDERVRSPLPRGSVVARIFSLTTLTYVYSPSLRQYGWIRLEPSAAVRRWRVLRRETLSGSAQIPRVAPAIKQRVEEVNTKLRRLFEHLNTKGSRRIEPPQWRVQVFTDSMTCTLVTSLPARHFAESSSLLAGRIEGALLGTDLRVYASPGYLQIR